MIPNSGSRIQEGSIAFDFRVRPGVANWANGWCNALYLVTEFGRLMRAKSPAISLLFLAASLFLPQLPLFSQDNVPTDPVTQESLKFARVYQDVEANYMSPLRPDSAVLEGAIRGMLTRLDPFSSFFDQGQFEMLQEETRGKALGFGSIVYVEPGRVTIIQTQQGTPSWRAGLGPGDQILAVNGTTLAGLGVRQLVQLLQESKSHPVGLRVMRPGQPAPENIAMNPAEVNLPTVDVSFLFPDGVGYIHVASFESQTPAEVAHAIEKFGPSRLKGLVLDLRANPGGMLAAAVGVTSIFLKPGSVILTVQGRTVARKTYDTIAVPVHLEVPVIVLVGRSTASAAEVVTAALQDHDRALVVGEPTFGKGVVESIMPLSDHTGLALLTAAYFTPSGRCIQKPLPGTALQDPAFGIPAGGKNSTRDPFFRTDDGRPVRAGGGVTPDVRVAGWKLDPWLEFLKQTGVLATFATQFVNLHKPISRSFEPDAQTLDSFHNFLAGQQLRAPAQYWSHDQGYLKAQIRSEVFTMAFGLNVGNEASAQSDPQVRRALSLFPEVAKLLEGPSRNHGAVTAEASSSRQQ
jgi:carboxyl-terminal processing protease